jgi:hypothetical protein
MFKVCLADHSRLAVRTAAIVTGGKTIDAEHTYSTPGELKQRGAANSAAANDNDVVTSHVDLLKLKLGVAARVMAPRTLQSLPEDYGMLALVPIPFL